MKADKTNAFNKILSIAKNEKATEVMANAAGHTKPPKLSANFFNKTYVPDAVLKYQDHTDFYLVETQMNKKEIPDKISRWIMVSSEARRLGGELFIMAAESVAGKIRDLLQAKMIKAVVVPI